MYLVCFVCSVVARTAQSAAGNQPHSTLKYRHFGTKATNAWTCCQSQMPKLLHGARIPSGLVAKVKMAKMTKI